MRSLKSLISQSADLRVFSLGLIWSVLGTVAVRLTPMITTILISHWFGIAAVGTFGITYGTMLSASFLASSGVNLMATRNVAAYAAKDPVTAGRLAGMALLLAGGCAVTLGLLIFLFSEAIAVRLLRQPELAFYLRVISPIIVVTALNNTQIAILSGLQQFKTIARLNTIMGCLMIAAVPVGLYFYGLTGAFAGLGTAYLAGGLIAAPATTGALPSSSLPTSSTVSRSTRTTCGMRWPIGPGRSAGSRTMSAPSLDIVSRGPAITWINPSMPACRCPAMEQK
jgi:O-antigen/teichoic acid export membrane protein